MDIFVSHELSSPQLARMRRIAGADAVHFCGEFEQNTPVHETLARCEVVFGNLPPDWLPQTRSLRWMQLISVGFGEYEHLDWHRLGKQLTVTNLAGFFAEPVAQSALAGILALYRGIDALVRSQRAKQWHKDHVREKLRMLDGANVIMLGYGSINRRLAEMLAPFRCRVTPFASNAKIEQLDAALPVAEVVICAAPERPNTRGLFDGARLDRCMGGAVFVNLGRGSIVDEDALVQRLESGRLGGAVLDVTTEEPLPTDHALWSCPNVVLTQHTGGGSTDEVDRKIELFADNLSCYRAGEPLHGVVDFERGY